MSVRNNLLSTTAVIGCTLMMPAAASAQQATERSATDEVVDAKEIVVTGSLTVRDGYKAPTPVTVARTEDLVLSAPSNIPDALNQLPQFLGSSKPTIASASPGDPNRGNQLNLRNLGAERVLILLDGLRVPPTNYTGRVDSNIIPQLLVERVDVVTAGASATYGSDAVSGVVNFVINNKFEGFKAVLQDGITDEGDAHSYRVGAAAGFKVGERGHILVSAEQYHIDGLTMQDRPYLSQSLTPVGSVVGGGVPGSVTNPLKIVDNTRLLLGTAGGNFALSAASGPLIGIGFSEPGQYGYLDFGTPTGTPGYYVGGDFWKHPPGFTLASEVKTQQAFLRGSYDLTDNVSGYVQGIGSISKARTYGSPRGTVLSQTIYSGNAFLPAALQAQLTAAGLDSVPFQKIYDEAGPAYGDDKTTFYSLGAGLTGKIGGTFVWKIDYSYGNTREKVIQRNSGEIGRLLAALDAVSDGSGNIVCRVTLTNPTTYPGCVPLNPFGRGAGSAAAFAFINQVNPQYESSLDQHNVQATIAGDPFSLWAGPVSVAVGAGYRQSNLSLQGNGDPGVDWSALAVGVRGYAPFAPHFDNSVNVGFASGSQTVKEVFGEVVVPLAKDLPFLQSLEVTGAARYTDYKTSGAVTTWKVGGTWKPIDSLLIRSTYSRDIRAPGLYDLYAGTLSFFGAGFDPHTNTNGFLQTIGGGNPDLKPEKGRTISAGFVFQPNFIRGFSMSLDYFNVKVTGAIGQLGFAPILQQCEDSNGTSPICDLVSRPFPFSDHSAANRFNFVRTIPLNIGAIKTEGVDLDASYRTQALGGNLAMRLYMNYTGLFSKQASATDPSYNDAGYAGVSQTGANAVPKVRGLISANYSGENFSVFVQEQLIGKLHYGDARPTGHYLGDPSIPNVFYTDVTLSYRLKAGGGKVELSTTINNAFDRKAPVYPNTLGIGWFPNTITSLYDTYGRRFTVGARASF